MIFNQVDSDLNKNRVDCIMEKLIFMNDTGAFVLKDKTSREVSTMYMHPFKSE